MVSFSFDEKKDETLRTARSTGFGRNDEEFSYPHPRSPSILFASLLSARSLRVGVSWEQWFVPMLVNASSRWRIANDLSRGLHYLRPAETAGKEVMMAKQLYGWLGWCGEFLKNCIRTSCCCCRRHHRLHGILRVRNEREIVKNFSSTNRFFLVDCRTLSLNYLLRLFFNSLFGFYLSNDSCLV